MKDASRRGTVIGYKLESPVKIYGSCCCVLAWGCFSVLGADEVNFKQVVKGKVEEINQALIKEDFGKVADLTHPQVVRLMGGRDKMISVMEAGTKEMKAKGFAFRSVAVGNPSDPVAAGADLYAVIPFTLEMTAPGGKIVQKSFVIGVSSDQGKTWSFVNGDQEPKKIKQVLPNLPEKLKLPEQQKPIFMKD